MFEERITIYGWLLWVVLSIVLLWAVKWSAQLTAVVFNGALGEDAVKVRRPQLDSLGSNFAGAINQLADFVCRKTANLRILFFSRNTDMYIKQTNK
ncbi:MAG TPA: hypothetical protein VIO58_15260 [Candidatus Methanoperedens sp.]